MGSLTEEKKQLIKKMWAEHFTSGQIAAEIGATRSSVMGYVNRSKLLRNPGVVKAARKEQKKKQPEKHFKLVAINGELVRKRSVTIPPQRKRETKNTIMDLKSDSCRFIEGEVQGIETVYCCKPAKKGSYCEFHAELCYDRRATKKSDKKKKSGLMFFRPNSLVFTE